MHKGPRSMIEFLVWLLVMWLWLRWLKRSRKPKAKAPSYDPAMAAKQAQILVQLESLKQRLAKLEPKPNDIAFQNRIAIDAINALDRCKAALIAVLKATGADESQIDEVLARIDNEPNNEPVSH